MELFGISRNINTISIRQDHNFKTMSRKSSTKNLKFAVGFCLLGAATAQIASDNGISLNKKNVDLENLQSENRKIFNDEAKSL